MKRVLFLLLLLVCTLVGCNSSSLSLSEISVVPSDVQNKIDSNYTLQLINDGEDISYIIFHSKGEVVTNIEAQGDTLEVRLEETYLQNDAMEQHVYKLTKDPEHEIIEVYINGKSMPFDNVTGL